MGCPTSSWVRPLQKFPGRDSDVSCEQPTLPEAVGTGAVGLEGKAGEHATAPTQGKAETDHGTEVICDLLVTGAFGDKSQLGVR